MRSLETFSNDWMDAHLEAYLDGELSAEERLRFEQGLAADAEWEDELLLADRIRRGLRALPEPVCPPYVAGAVMARVRRDARASWIQRVYAWVRNQVAVLWQPALAMTMVLILAVSASLIGRSEQPDIPPDVKQALAEVEWTLGYLSDVGRQTGRVVRNDVIAERVVSPVQDAMGLRAQHPNRNQR